MLNGVEFPASAEILWTVTIVNGTATLDDDQKLDWPTTVSADTTFTYTDQGPEGTVGIDAIRASIGNMDSNTVEMTWLPRNAAPTAGNNAASTFSGTPVTVAVLGNDTDPDGDALTVTGTSGGPANGSVTINGDGTITYTPNLGFAGTDSFTYAIADGKGGTASATVTITVTKRRATVTPGSGTKVYGTADPALTPTSSGFLAGGESCSLDRLKPFLRGGGNQSCFRRPEG